MNPIKQFEQEKKEIIQKLGSDKAIQEASQVWLETTYQQKYSYNFNWLGIPIIQYPQDIVAMQEIIWQVKPDLIIETGVAHGGSIIFYASMLELLGGNRKVIGIDIDIRKHNRERMEQHPHFKQVQLLEGSSTSPEIFETVQQEVQKYQTVLVCLDSFHTHEHVLKELELYSPLVSKGSYLVVFDTIVEQLPNEFFPNRPWGKGNNPKTAVDTFLKTTIEFKIDTEIDNKLLLSANNSGYLKKI